MRLIRWIFKTPKRILYFTDRTLLDTYRMSVEAKPPYTILEQELEIDFHRPKPVTTKVSEKIFKEVR